MGVRVTGGGTSIYRQSYTGVGELLRAPFIGAAMLARTKRAQAVAESISPVDTTDYITSFDSDVVIKVPDGSRVPVPRAVGVLSNSSNHAFFIEWGNRKIRQYRVLGKAMHAAGGTT